MSINYFLENLNYSMMNEDSSLERAIIERFQSKSICSVSGSGSRCLSLLNSSSNKLDILDVSSVQLRWAKLKAYTFKNLSYNEFMMFWGYTEISSTDRKKLFEKSLKGIEPELKSTFDSENWAPPLFYGNWEKTYLKLNKLVQLFLGKKTISKISQIQSLEDQIKLTNKLYFRIRWFLILTIVGNKTLFNALLYKGHFIRKNIDKTYVKFYYDVFKKLFSQSTIKESFFLQLSFLGKLVSPELSIIEAQEDVFLSIKNSLMRKAPNYIQENILEYLKKGTHKYDFISMSDVPSYFSDDLGRSFLQEITQSVNSKGIIVVRYYLRIYRPKLEGFVDITDQFINEINAEKVQMYEIKVYQKK